jgi:hypothetical protein
VGYSPTADPPKGTDVTPPSNKQTRKAAETTARERAAALKAQAAREERRRKMMARGGIALVVVAVIAGIVAIGLANSGTKKEKLTGPLPSVKVTGAKSAPTAWTAPSDVEAKANLAGLSILPNETLDRHDHAHLDIWIDGKQVNLPAYVGIAGGASPTGFSSLHTHDATGVIHIESPANQRFLLGQVFDEWNVYLSSSQIGNLASTGGKTLNVYLNGKKVTTDPNNIELLAHEEIAIVYGTAAENAKVKVPSTYKWTNGL